MVRSMTGFSRSERVHAGIGVTIEIKTVNSKYLNVDVSIGETFSEIELSVSRLIKERIKRGTVKSRVEISVLDEDELLKPDFAAATSIYNSLRAIAIKLSLNGEISIDSMSRFKEILRTRVSEELLERVWKTLKPALEEAIDSLNKDRDREGHNLGLAMKEYLDRLQEIVLELRSMTEHMIQYYRDFLRNRVEKFYTGELDENRLEQEVVLMAERADISEEIVRLISHIESFGEIMSNSNECGVQLDFICQELHRELSTIASKSKKLEISTLAVEGRTLVNKLREQVQNVE